MKTFILLRQYWPIFVIVILILGFSFYWYELRSTMIRKNCAEKAIDAYKARQNSVGFDDQLSAQRYFKLGYEVCLHKNGL